MSARVQLLQALALLEAGEPQHRVLSQLREQAADWQPQTAARLTAVSEFLSKTGSAASQSLTQLLNAETTRLEFENRLSVAMQAPAMTARLMKWLPLVAVVLAQIAGLNPLSFLVFQPPGWVLVVVAWALNWLGARWTKRLIVATTCKIEDSQELAFELTAQGLLAGLSIRQTLAAVGQRHFGQLEAVNQVLQQHQLSGLALHTLLFARASQLRLQAQQAQEQQVARLPVRQMGPMGLFYLPAFMLLTVVPIAATALTNQQ